MKVQTIVKHRTYYHCPDVALKEPGVDPANPDHIS